MTRFATDADLLAIDPGVFIDLPLTGQEKLRIIDGALTDTALSSATGGFDALAAGDVAVIRSNASDVTAVAIASVEGPQTLTLASRPIGLAATTGLTVVVRTFAPQAEATAAELLAAVGVDPADPDQPLDATAIVSTALMRRLEALGTLSRAYEAALRVGGGEESLREKGERYERRYRAGLRSARVLIDADGDGEAEVWRTPGVLGWRRV